MPVFLLNESLAFPPPHYAEADGLLAVGGDLSTERLLLAYKKGVFPWFNPDEPILWWSPDPRCVLLPSQVLISKSMRQVLRRGQFIFSFDNDFETVIRLCQAPRAYSDSTWISEEIIEAYCKLHELGYAHSLEVRLADSGALVGGLYGVSLGKAFFGESMFSKVSNASKAAFIMLAQWAQEQQFSMVDCQMHTAHLERLGATMLQRSLFLKMLLRNNQLPTMQGSWAHFVLEPHL
ncbi:MAG: leucyl/phenylalanyl-tRNA--protein transferase [Sphingobacteriales bacterium]|nr:leucyl/phenylalanyl-tRNA--protein transferase [Sphingobacteriales bacterium]